jgi:hypothetical protein
MLEEVLRSGERPAHVLYGLIFGHELRNVAAPIWLRSLAHRTVGTVATPYVTVDASGTLQRQPPITLWKAPMRDSLAAAALFEDAVSRVQAAQREKAGVPATQLLIEEMARRCRAEGIRFSVVLLEVGELFTSAYRPFLDARGIEVIGCQHSLTTDMRVVREGHPNGRMHALWGDCVAAALERSAPRPPLPAAAAPHCPLPVESAAPDYSPAALRAASERAQPRAFRASRAPAKPSTASSVTSEAPRPSRTLSGR